MNELQEENFRHQQAQDAILCRETLILDSGHVGSELANSCAAAMNERYKFAEPGAMDELEQPMQAILLWFLLEVVDWHLAQTRSTGWSSW